MNELDFINHANKMFHDCKSERLAFGEDYHNLKFNEYLSKNFNFIVKKYLAMYF
jgi:hypothetical protein